MVSKHCLAALFAAFATTSGLCEVRAESGGSHEISDADRESARKSMATGRKEEGLGNHQAAAAAYGKAYDLTHIPTAGVRYAAALAGTGALIKARDVAAAVAKSSPKATEPTVFAEARSEASDLAEAFTRRIPRLRIRLAEGVTNVELDGIAVVVTDKAIELDPGEHLIRALQEGAPIETKFKALEGREDVLKLVKEDTPHPPVKSQPENAGTTPRDIVLFSGLAIAGIGIVAGTASGIIALSHANKGKEFCVATACGEQARPYYDRAAVWGTISTFSFVGAGIGGVAAAIGFFMPHGKNGNALRPQVGIGYLGLSGAFE
jgi:hypothetical protein